MKRLLLIALIIMCAAQTGFAQIPICKIIITTPGYTNIYRYDKEGLREGMQKDFRVNNVSIESEYTQAAVWTEQKEKIRLKIGEKTFNFIICPESPLVRLVYDRNKRSFTGVGFNFIENEEVNYEGPSFKGNSLSKLPSVWDKDINKLIDDRSLLSATEPHVMIFEADIDENGNVHKIVELNGALRQYSKAVIDKIYDVAVRGWQPAKRNGVPFRTYAQIRVELLR